MESKSSLLWAQKPTTGTYSQKDETNLAYLTSILIHLHFGLPEIILISAFSINYVHALVISCFVPHALPILSSFIRLSS
jgi:hypothetical protein